MRKTCILFGILLLLALAIIPNQCAHSSQTCIDPQFVKRTAVQLSSIQPVQSESTGILQTTSGTGVFVSPTLVVTVSHIGNKLTRRNAWTEIELLQYLPWHGELFHKERINVRQVAEINHGLRNAITVIELARPFGGNFIAPIRESPLVPGEFTSIVGYPQGVLSFGTGTYLGRFTSPEPCDNCTHDERFKLPSSEQGPIFEYGSSGSPIFDCDARLVAILSHAVVQIRTDTVWGETTNLGVPTTGVTLLLDHNSQLSEQ